MAPTPALRASATGPPHRGPSPLEAQVSGSPLTFPLEVCSLPLLFLLVGWCIGLLIAEGVMYVLDLRSEVRRLREERVRRVVSVDFRAGAMSVLQLPSGPGSGIRDVEACS